MNDYQPLHSEIWKRIRQIEIKSDRLVNQVLSGQYTSVFKGLGLEFEEVRPYQEGDDERHIDWNVSARTGQMHIKRFVEEREQSLFLVVDVSPSVYFGSQQRLKMDLAIEVSAMMAFSALKNNDRVGLMTFDSEVRQVIPSRKGRKHALRVIRSLFSAFEGQEQHASETNLTRAMNYLSHMLHRRGIVFIVSDFLNVGSLFPLKVLSRRHDCVAVCIRDPLENTLPDLGWVRLHDPETQQESNWNLSNPKVRQNYLDLAEKRNLNLDTEFKKMALNQIVLETNSESVWKELLKFYKHHR